ncbi:MAG: general secretion pathway protein GspK [Deltaproteobacteria bacterium]|nr:MAG: general secretion pathway protein GspK [Deltaproteobacteria bacterium]
MRGLLKNQKGIALLVVLMVIAILAAVIVEFSYSARVNLHIVANHKDELKTYYIARAGIEASKALLQYDLDKDGRKRVDYIVTGEDADPETETWSQVRLLTTTEFGGVPIGDGILVGGITDESSKININLLAYTYEDGKHKPKENIDLKSDKNSARTIVIKLLDNVLPDDIDVEPVDIANNIIDWIDVDDDDGDAGDDYYQGLIPPYECKDAPINSISELKMVRGINDTVYEKIEKYFTPYGEANVNINTASFEVIQAINDVHEGKLLSEEELDNFRLSPYDPERGHKTSISSPFGVASNYFSIECIGIVNLGKKTEYAKTIKAIVKRNKPSSDEDIPPIEVLSWRVE